jgi:biotin operon repressor
MGNILVAFMYEQTFEIEHRLTDLLRLVGAGKYSTPRLAELLDVSIPTISRGIRALRARGNRIHSLRLNDGTWCYHLHNQITVEGKVAKQQTTHSGARI